jgi:hypothetical protein
MRIWYVALAVLAAGVTLVTVFERTAQAALTCRPSSTS